MVAKMTSKNQITIPNALASKYTSPYFDIQQDGDKLVLTPVNHDATAQVRAKLDELGITENDVAAAVEWAREPSGSSSSPRRRPPKGRTRVSVQSA